MGLISLAKTIRNDIVSDAEDDLMANFNVIKDELNGEIQGANILNRSISASKISGDIGMEKIKLHTLVFSGYQSAVQSFAAATLDVVEFDVQQIDELGGYNATTGRFTPSIRGYYLVGWTVQWDLAAAADDLVQTILQKSGSNVVAHREDVVLNSQHSAAGSALVFCNGATDYVRIVGYSTTARDTSLGGGKSATLSIKYVGYA